MDSDKIWHIHDSGTGWFNIAYSDPLPNGKRSSLLVVAKVYGAERAEFVRDAMIREYGGTWHQPKRTPLGRLRLVEAS